MPNEIYHRSDWGESKAEGFGDVYYDHAATNKLYNHSDYYENSDGTDATLKDLNNKASIVLTPTAYSDGSLNTVIPPYAPSYIENVPFVTSEWAALNEGWSIDETNNKLVAEATWTGTNKNAQYNISEIQVGKTVKVSFDVVITAGELSMYRPFSKVVTTSGSYSFTGVAASNNILRFRNRTTDFAGEITNIKVEVIEEADFDFSRGSSATRVNEQGLVEDVQILSGELVQNGDFEQIGSELVTNGNFETDSDWTKQTGWTISDGKAIATSTNGSLYQANDFVSGKIYRIRFQITSYESGGLICRFNNDETNIFNSVGTHTLYFKSDNSFDYVYFLGDNSFTGSIDNVSVKEVGQNWTFGSSWSMGDGVAISDGGASYLTASGSSRFTSGKKYRVSLEIVEYNSGTVSLPFDAAGSNANYQNSAGVKTADIIAVNNNSPIYIYSSGFDGTIDNVSVKEVTDDTDLPRIDFTDGTGSLLLEPQRTNLIDYSEDLTQWTSSSGIELTSSQLGVGNSNDAWKVQRSSAYDNIFKPISFSTTSTCSIYAKKGNYSFLRIAIAGILEQCYFDLENGTIGTTTNLISSNIEYVNNGWYRCSMTFNNASGTGIYIQPVETNGGIGNSGTGHIFVQYPQVEVGSYPTSYIPTSGSTVTRSIEAANNSGNADLFNDSEGVLYAEVERFDNETGFSGISISDDTGNNQVVFKFRNTTNLVWAVVKSGGVNQANMQYTASDLTVFNKLAIKYKANDFALWFNGVQVLTDTSGIVPTGINKLSFEDGNGSEQFRGKTKAVAVFKEALSNDLLERLTGEGYESFRLLAEANNYTII